MCALLQWELKKMYVRHPQNSLYILEVCNIYCLAPAAVKHTFFIDPGRIAGAK